MVLRRVDISDGGVTKLADRWRDRGHRVPDVPDYATDALTALYEGGPGRWPIRNRGRRPGWRSPSPDRRFEQLCQLALGCPLHSSWLPRAGRMTPPLDPGAVSA